MKSSIRLTIFAAMLVAAVPAACALSGRTFYHYVAYEAAFWPKTAPVTAAQYPKIALNSLQSLPFDALVFAPVFGFGSMAGILKSATYPTHQPQSRWLDRWKNAMPELVKAGIDPIAETVKWCRGHKREAVVALPVNLIGPHGAKPTSENPITSWHAYLWPAFKAANPDCLMDSTGQLLLGMDGYGTLVREKNGEKVFMLPGTDLYLSQKDIRALQAAKAAVRAAVEIPQNLLTNLKKMI